MFVRVLVLCHHGCGDSCAMRVCDWHRGSSSNSCGASRRSLLGGACSAVVVMVMMMLSVAVVFMAIVMVVMMTMMLLLVLLLWLRLQLCLLALGKLLMMWCRRHATAEWHCGCHS